MVNLHSDEARKHKTMASNLLSGSESLGELRLKLSLNNSFFNLDYSQLQEHNTYQHII